jgi:uncharacterized protein
MSFAVTADDERFEWKGWRNLLSPSYLRMLRDILPFNAQSVASQRSC